MQGTQKRNCLIKRPLWTVTANSKPRQLRIKFNMTGITHKANLQRAHSCLVKTGEKPEVIIDLDIKGLVRIQDTKMENFTQNK